MYERGKERARGDREARWSDCDVAEHPVAAGVCVCVRANMNVSLL